MSSITKGELIVALESYPDDYEVIVKMREIKDDKKVESLMYINGIQENKEFNEIYLMN